MAATDISKYSHSPIHKSVLSRDYFTLKQIISSLPRLSEPSTIETEASSISEEAKAEAISAIVDCRDVPNRETPLHLAVKLSDATSTELLMLAGADCGLHNGQGWSALREAICNGEENLAKIILRHYHHIVWAKWCRRLPRLVSAMKRMRDFYMEIKFHFESSMIPFVSRIAPSDTFKIWKRGANLRADMTLAGFDGFKCQRKDQSVLFLGDGGGLLCIISHKDKAVSNVFEGAGAQPSESEIELDLSAMSEISMFRPGVDATQAVLLPQLNWRRQEKTEMVGPWKARVYNMHHVVVSVKSRKVPVAMSDKELFSKFRERINRNDSEVEEYEDVLTKDEREQLDVALREVVDNDDVSCAVQRESRHQGESEQDRRWFGKWGNKDYTGRNHEASKEILPPRSSLVVDEKVSDLLGDSPSRLESRPARHSIEVPIRREKVKDKERYTRKFSSSLENGLKNKESNKGSEYKKRLRPVLWLSSNFPLQTEELLPLLDVLPTKLKEIHSLRDLLTKKLPTGTFPVKVAVPVIPTVRVLFTFTKFQESQPSEEEEFSTPPLSPGTEATRSSCSQSMKTVYRHTHTLSSPTSQLEDNQDPFLIPPDYTWMTPEEMKKTMRENKVKSKKGRGRNC